jgi:hypothetical protein
MEYFCIYQQKSRANSEFLCNFSNNPDENKIPKCPYSEKNIRYAGVIGNNHQFKIDNCENFKNPRKHYQGLVKRLLYKIN